MSKKFFLTVVCFILKVALSQSVATNFTVVTSFNTGASLRGIAFDSFENLYIANAQGPQILFVNRKTGITTTVAGTGQIFPGDGNRATLVRLLAAPKVAIDPFGNIFIPDGNIFRFVNQSNGVISTVIGNGTAGYTGDGGNPKAALVNGVSDVLLDAVGNLFFADAGNHRVRLINRTDGTVSTVAGGNFVNGIPATDAYFQPVGVTIDSGGNIFICETLNHQILVVNRTTGVISLIAGNGVAGFSGDNGPAINASFRFPSGIAIDSVGNLYISDSLNNRIRFINRTTGIISTIVGSGASGVNGDGGLAINAVLSSPQGISVDFQRNIYVADSNNGLVRVVNFTTGIISTIAGGGTNSASGQGPATSFKINPTGIAVDLVGNLYIADSSNHQIRFVNRSTGIMFTFAGVGLAGFSGDGGLALDAFLFFPRGVSIDSVGNLYISDRNNNRVRFINRTTGIISTIAGKSPGFAANGGDGGLAGDAALSSVSGVAIDAQGNLYIADTNNGRIRFVNRTNGKITTIAGGGFGGPLATRALLASPNNLAFGKNSANLYVSDLTLNRILRVNLASGIISSFAGNGFSESDGDGNLATNAAVKSPGGIAVDIFENLYIIEFGKNRVRFVNGKTGIISTIAQKESGTSLSFGGMALGPSGTVYVADQVNVLSFAFKACSSTSDCDDGVFCNGIGSLCISGICTAEIDPCLNQLFCNSVCNETLKTCERANGTTCSDGAGTCQSGVCVLPSTSFSTGISLGSLIAAIVVPVLLLGGVIVVGAVVFKRKFAKQVIPPDFALQEAFQIAACLIQNVVVQEKLGSGNFGSVYKGIWNEKTLVALKKLNSSENIQQFLSEARMLQQLRHPNIVQFFGIFLDGDDLKPILVMEFMEKGSLLDLLQTEGDTLSPEQLQMMCCDTLQGMTYLESKNIIHRDLAARNLLIRLNAEGQYVVKVADFGMGKISSTSVYYAKDSQMPVKWVAPEVIQFLRYSSKSDVWAFGIVIWEVYSLGQIPYAGLSNVETAEKVKNGYRMPPPELCPKELSTVMKKCWHEKPENRPSFIQLVADLKEYFRIPPLPLENIDIPTIKHLPGSELMISVYSS